MLKKGKSSGSAIPGTVSSTTARGVLPNYSGHATASLTPAIANASPKDSCLKTGEVGEAGSTSTDEEKKVENRPPSNNVKGALRRTGG